MELEGTRSTAVGATGAEEAAESGNDEGSSREGKVGEEEEEEEEVEERSEGLDGVIAECQAREGDVVEEARCQLYHPGSAVHGCRSYGVVPHPPFGLEGCPKCEKGVDHYYSCCGRGKEDMGCEVKVGYEYEKRWNTLRAVHPPHVDDDLTGRWFGGHSQLISIVQDGRTFQALCPVAQWSPAIGSIARGVVRAFGVTGLFLPPSTVVFSTGRVWHRVLPIPRRSLDEVLREKIARVFYSVGKPRMGEVDKMVRLYSGRHLSARDALVEDCWRDTSALDLIDEVFGTAARHWECPTCNLVNATCFTFCAVCGCPRPERKAVWPPERKGEGRAGAVRVVTGDADKVYSYIPFLQPPPRGRDLPPEEAFIPTSDELARQLAPKLVGLGVGMAETTQLIYGKWASSARPVPRRCLGAVGKATLETDGQQPTAEEREEEQGEEGEEFKVGEAVLYRPPCGDTARKVYVSLVVDTVPKVYIIRHVNGKEHCTTPQCLEKLRPERTPKPSEKRSLPPWHASHSFFLKPDEPPPHIAPIPQDPAAHNTEIQSTHLKGVGVVGRVVEVEDVRVPPEGLEDLDATVAVAPQTHDLGHDAALMRRIEAIAQDLPHEFENRRLSLRKIRTSLTEGESSEEEEAKGPKWRCFDCDFPNPAKLKQCAACNMPKDAYGTRGRRGSADAPVPHFLFDKGEYVPSTRDEFQSHGMECLNGYRVRHDALPLHFDADLARNAQKQAEACAKAVSVVRGHNAGQGQNIFWTTGERDPLRAVEKACEAWYAEIDIYRKSPGLPGLRGGAGQFTQMVWKTTTDIGWGIAYAGQRVYVVANFYPAGNILSDPDVLACVSYPPSK
eukprot:Sspe_Gene.20502::Locus_7535_Transcript_1_1_Confidence_1.000_Length_2888::g.20502::m.20502